MASNILQTLQKIESDRQTQIETAREFGWTVDDNVSFADLSACISSNTFKEATPELRTWTRPADWPNGETILDETDSVGTLKPGIFVLLNANYMTNTTILPQLYVTDLNTYSEVLNGTFSNSTGSGTTSDSFVNTNANAYLTSDGAFYDDVTADITHTWDTTKDIVCADGTYRWIIFFFDENYENYGGVTLQSWPIVEFICDFIGKKPARNIWCNYLSIRGGSPGSMSHSTKWPSIRLLQSFIIRSLINDKDDQYKVDMFHSMQVNIGGWKFWNTGYFYNLSNFEIGDNYLYTWYGNTNSILYCSNLSEINVKGSNFSGSIRIPSACKKVNFNSSNGHHLYIQDSTPYLTEINAPMATLYINYNGSSRTIYFPEDVSLTVRTINMQFPIPYNWSTISKNKYVGFPLPLSDTSLNNYMTTQIVTIDLSEATVTTTGASVVYTNSFSYISASNFAPRLQRIIFPENIISRYFINTVVRKQILLDLIANLKDISNDTVYYPYLLLSSANYYKLTPAEIKVAADKGWVVLPFFV